MSVYAVSDLHGNLKLYKQIKAFLKPEDKVYCLGDCGDRGPNSWETIKAVAADPQFIYLMGNHEHMLVGAMCEYLKNSRVKEFQKMYPGENMRFLVASNGGEATINDWINEGASAGWLNFLIKLPYCATYNNKYNEKIILTHAGYTPPGTFATDYDLIWSREHFWDSWPNNFDNVYIIHGHTPCKYLSKDLNMVHGPEYRTDWAPIDGAIQYADGHKIDIDMGTPYTNTALLLNLDTFDEHIFAN